MRRKNCKFGDSKRGFSPSHKKQFYHFNRVKRKIFGGKRLDLLKKHIPLRTNNNLKHKIRYVCSRFSYPYPVAHRLDDGF